MRLQRLLALLRSPALVSLAESALAAGYAGQAHMNREFREFAGSTPQQYRRRAPAAGHHVTMMRP